MCNLFYYKGKFPDKSTGQGNQLSKLMLVNCQLGHKEYIQGIDSLKSKVFDSMKSIGNRRPRTGSHSI